MHHMDYGLYLLTTNGTIDPAPAALLGERLGFHTFYVPEHTHIPLNTKAVYTTPGQDPDAPDARGAWSLDPFVSLATASAVTSSIRLATGVALPVQHDPIALAKAIASLDHLSGGRVTLGVGFAWNIQELVHHGVPRERRRTMLREYLEAMHALWTEEEATYDGEFVSFGPSWAWPKPTQSHIPVIVGAAGTEKNCRWIARSADGWMTSPGDSHIDDQVKLLQDTWVAADREGEPRIVGILDRPDHTKIEHWAGLGVQEIAFLLPIRPRSEIEAYMENLAKTLNIAQ
jgi:probable F420-dependent oxidoreductase